jgi:hypothetical protein
MKCAILLAIAIVTFSSLPFASHRNDAVAQESAASARGTLSAVVDVRGPRASDIPSVSPDSKEMRPITPVRPELVYKPDERSPKTRDSVAETNDKVRSH